MCVCVCVFFFKGAASGGPRGGPRGCMYLVHVVLAAHAVAARLWRAGPGHDANPARLRRVGPGRGLAAVARHAGPGQNGPRPGPVGGPVYSTLHTSNRTQIY